MTSSRPRPLRIVLIVLFVVALLVLAGVLAVLIPILTHQSAGGSGQELPQDYVSSVAAKGADGRTRELSAKTADGADAELENIAPGESLVVTGSGFDSGIGIYLAICAIPATPDEKPGPCLGGIPEGAETGEANAETGLSSAWITSDWAWRAFATQSYDDNASGSFTATLTVPPPTVDGLDCRVSRCAITTRADHTAAKDRVQDMMLPVAFRTE
ncbi:hypothetical protein [Leucobacter chromiireducens]|uniref:hypothetical protein n=1 Tax=Leucobacter chromiireducens TaxID=283877 RepID=UPI003F7D08FE